MLSIAGAFTEGLSVWLQMYDGECVLYRTFDDPRKVDACVELVNGLDDPLLRFIEDDNGFVLPLVVEGGDL